MENKEPYEALEMEVIEFEEEDVITKSGIETPFNTEEIKIDQRAGKGEPVVMALMDDVVVGLIKK